MEANIVTGKGWAIAHGRWQDVLRGILSPTAQVKAIITDPPYTKKTLIGYRSGSDYKRAKKSGTSGERHTRYNIPYDAITSKELRDLVKFAYEKAFYLIAFNDHMGWAELQSAAKKTGFYTFSPVPWIKTDPPPRMNGDGPTTSAEWIMVARKMKKTTDVRSRVGYYITNQDTTFTNSFKITGSKPIGLMRAIIRDYTLPGDIVVDPYAGSGTTLLAAAMENRYGIGAEVSRKHFEMAVARLQRGYTTDMFASNGPPAAER